MGDKQIGQVHIPLEPHQHIDDLCLNGYVQRRDRLVTDQKIRVKRQCTCDADSLPLTAGEFVWETVGVFLAQPDQFQQFQYPFPALGLIGKQLVNQQSFFDNLADGEKRVQRCVRVLKDHLHPPGHLFPVAAFKMGNILSIKPDGSAVRFIQSQDGASNGRFAAAGFTDQAECLTPGDGKADIVHCLENLFFAGGEVFFQVFYLNERRLPLRGSYHRF